MVQYLSQPLVTRDASGCLTSPAPASIEAAAGFVMPESLYLAVFFVRRVGTVQTSEGQGRARTHDGVVRREFGVPVTGPLNP